MKIEEIWSEIERSKEVHSAIICKRFSSSILADIYVAVRNPEKQRCLAVHIDASLECNIAKWNKYKDIQVLFVSDEQDKRKKYLLVVLLNNDCRDIFSVFCEDLLFHVAGIRSDDRLLNELLGRLDKWELLFEKNRQSGLSEESQRGLYGELYVLRKLIMNRSADKICVSSWKGPEGGVQDFQSAGWALEVKTTHGKNHQKMYISSERQLDTNIIRKIVLYNISLDIREKKGETLNDVVDNILELLSSRYRDLSEFKMKLIIAGFFDKHRSNYADIGYNIRKERIFRVREGFPRITENDICGGVGDVKYSIVVEDAAPWNMSETEMMSIIGE